MVICRKRGIRVINFKNLVKPSPEQWKTAIMGMRNPMNSWNKSDSDFKMCEFVIGRNDLDLMKRLVKSGTDHRKFMRMLVVYVDIIAPLYWWKEFDTYRSGVEKNSCSTMHKIHTKRFEREDFSIEQLINCDEQHWIVCIDNIISAINVAREKYLETKEQKYWWQIIQLLPSSYNQKRTIMLNYEVLLNIYYARKNHKLSEWHDFCDWIKNLPFMGELIGE